MRRLACRLSILAILAATGCAPRAAAAPRDAAPAPSAGLAAAIDAVVDRAPVDRTHWGIAVLDPRTGRWLYRRNAERHFIPASNTKLTVTAAALGLLGADWRYETRIRAAGPLDSATLVIEGSGDPTLSARFLGERLAAARMIADSIAAAGITGIAELIVDASLFDRVGVHPAWEAGDLPWTYAPPVAAFAFDEGTFRLVLEPGAAPGELARATQPDGSLQPLLLDLVTDTVGAPPAWTVDYTSRRDAVRITGGLPAGAAPDTVSLAVTDPADYAGRAVAAALARRDVAVHTVTIVQGARRSRPPGPGPLRPLAILRSPPLAAITAAILRPSQNWMAEQLLKTLGARHDPPGSWEDGNAAARAWLVATAGLDSASFRLFDGSGLSARNLLSPEAIVRILEHARAADWRLAFRDALPAPGMSGSTLASRLPGFEGRVRAKTGTISNVNSLSGYLITDAGTELTFSIMTNGTGLPSTVVRRAMDEVVTAIAREVQ